MRDEQLQRPGRRLWDAVDPRTSKVALFTELFGALVLIVTLIYTYRSLPLSLPVLVNVALLVLLVLTYSSAVHAIGEDDRRYQQSVTEWQQKADELQQHVANLTSERDRYRNQLQVARPELRRAAEAEVELRLITLTLQSSDIDAYLGLLPEHAFVHLINHPEFHIRMVRIVRVDEESREDDRVLKSLILHEQAVASHSFETSTETPLAVAKDAVQNALKREDNDCFYDEQLAPDGTPSYWRVSIGFRLADESRWHVFIFYVVGTEEDHRTEQDYIRARLREQLITATKLAYDRGNTAKLNEALSQKTTANLNLEQRLQQAQKVRLDLELQVIDAAHDPELIDDENRRFYDDLIAETRALLRESKDTERVIQRDNSVTFVLPIWKTRQPEMGDIAYSVLGDITVHATSDEPRVASAGDINLASATSFLQKLYDDAMLGNSGSLQGRRALERELRQRAQSLPGDGRHNLLLIDIPSLVMRRAHANPDSIKLVEKELLKRARLFHHGQPYEFSIGQYVIIGYDADELDTDEDIRSEAEMLSAQLTRALRASGDEENIHVGVFRCCERTLYKIEPDACLQHARQGWQQAVQGRVPVGMEVHISPLETLQEPGPPIRDTLPEAVVEEENA